MLLHWQVVLKSFNQTVDWASRHHTRHESQKSILIFMEELGLNNPSFVFWLMVLVGIQNLREAMAAGGLSRKLRDYISSQLRKRVFAS